MVDSITLGTTTYGTEKIFSCEIQTAQSLTGSELSIDKMVADVQSNGLFFRPYQTVSVAANDQTQTFYATDITRIGKTKWRITAESCVAIWDRQKHYGGIYDGSTLASSLIADLLSGWDYTLDTSLASVRIYGWLPVASVRSNLQQALFAIGGNLTKDDDGGLVIAPLTLSSVHSYWYDKVFSDGTVSTPRAAAAVSVLEHAYSAGSEDDRKEVFRGSTTANQIVEFTEPYSGYDVRGADIISSGVNFVQLSASYDAVVTAIPYRHSQTVFEYAGDVSGSDVPQVSNCTLISVANSLNVAKRVAAYYGSDKIVVEDVVSDGERAGQRVTAVDAYGDGVEGYIESIDRRYGALDRAKLTINSSYFPTGIGNNYSNVTVVTASGTVALPNTDHVRLVLIGGGQGGQGGGKGEDGKQPTKQEQLPPEPIYWLATESSGEYSTSEPFPDKGIGGLEWWSEVSIDPENGIQYGGKYYKWGFDSPLLENKLRIARLAAGRGTIYTPLYTDGSNVGAEYCVKISMTGEDVSYDILHLQSGETTGVSILTYADSTPGGKPGEPGVGGLGGNVHQVDLAITPGATATVTIGAGGTGGADNTTPTQPGEQGAFGTDTTIRIGSTTYSSASGDPIAGGYVCLFNNKTYATQGDEGSRGGQGGSYNSFNIPAPGESAQGNLGILPGGKVGVGIEYTTSPYAVYVGGGSGGGAAFSPVTDTDGGNASVSGATNRATAVYTTGKGGDGAVGAPKPLPAGVYGRGGNGGASGGGGGNAGGYADERGRDYQIVGAPGSGGYGNPGGKGANGCILILWGESDTNPGYLTTEQGALQRVQDSANKYMLPRNGAYQSEYSGQTINNFVTVVLGG